MRSGYLREPPPHQVARRRPRRARVERILPGRRQRVQRDCCPPLWWHRKSHHHPWVPRRHRRRLQVDQGRLPPSGWQGDQFRLRQAVVPLPHRPRQVVVDIVPRRLRQVVDTQRHPQDPRGVGHHLLRHRTESSRKSWRRTNSLGLELSDFEGK